MKKIKWILIVMILLLSINNISATEIYSIEKDLHATYGGGSLVLEPNSYVSEDPITYIAYETFTLTCPEGYSHVGNEIYLQSADTPTDNYLTYYSTHLDIYESGASKTISESYTKTVSGGWNYGQLARIRYDGTLYQGYGRIGLIVTTEGIYNLTGYVNCVDELSVDMNNGTGWIEVYYNKTNGMNFSYDIPIASSVEYRIMCDGLNVHQFTCNGNENFNKDACGYCTININDNCANLLNGAFAWIDDDGNIVYEGRNNPINISSHDINENDKLVVMWTTWLGALQKTCYAQFDHPINLFDPLVYWNMDVYVYDNESNPIYDANVDFNQDCVINGYPARNKFTDYDGLVEFTQCENKNANLVVSKDGYKTLSTAVSGGWYDAYTSTYEVSVVLQSVDSDNSSTWDLINDSINDTNATEMPSDIPNVNGTPNDIQLYFRNTEGYRITEVNDTDDCVRCYYSIWCDDSVSMTLEFQESSNGYDWSDVYTYGYYPDNDSYGYMNISNSYFNDSTLIYRAYIYDVSYPYDDRYAYLNVINVTNDSETHYENLTGYCMFMNTNKNGSIDYREDITCYTMVISDNASLRTVSLELYDNSTLIDYKNLTNSSFDDDIYGWYLGYNYILGHNYSLVLRGYDGSILDCDNVIAYNLVGNKLTIKITDSFNHPLSNVYVFCEHYGSINTGYLNYGTFEGLPDGETRYKASKSGYRSGLWSTVNLTSENEIVNYQLIQEKQEGSTAMVRLSDDDAKNLYYPLMYFLLTLILLGALINVIKQ